jgi:hypothetical protein
MQPSPDLIVTLVTFPCGLNHRWSVMQTSIWPSLFSVAIPAAGQVALVGVGIL